MDHAFVLELRHRYAAIRRIVRQKLAYVSGKPTLLTHRRLLRPWRLGGIVGRPHPGDFIRRVRRLDFGHG